MTEFRPSRFEILPIVIKNLIIINSLFFLAKVTIGAGGFFDMDQVLGLHHIKSPLFQPWQLVTFLFLHGDIMHLIMNMFALWMFGSVLENIWGPKRFLTFYFLCGIGSGLIQLISLWFEYHDMIVQYMQVSNHLTPEGAIAFYREFSANVDQRSIQVLQNYLHDPSSSSNSIPLVQYLSDFTNSRISIATVGASGAVFGILAAFVYLFPNTSFYLYFLVPIKAKWIGLFYFGKEIIEALQNSPYDNVAHWAHLGGGLVGFLLILTWNKKNKRHFY